MTIDDDRSIYIGGLPYNASEDTLRRVFNLYGSIVAVKVINSSVLTSNSTINKAKKIKIKVNFSFATKITSEVDGSELQRVEFVDNAFQIINNHGTSGKCYGFVTFRNPRSVIDAINDMNGKVESLSLQFFLFFNGFSQIFLAYATVRIVYRLLMVEL